MASTASTVEWLNSAFFGYVCNLVPITIVVYDTLLTIPREIDCIWRRKFGAVTLLFVSQRYVMMMLVALRLFNPTQSVGCRAFSILVYITTVVPSIGGLAFSTLRVWAVCNRFNAAVLLVLLCGVFEPSANLYNFSRVRKTFVDESGCEAVTDSNPSDVFMPIIVRSIAIVTDLLVLAFTWIKTVDIWRASRHMRQFRPKLSIMLLRDGTMYFVALSILNIVTLAVDVLSYLQPDLAGAQWVIVIPIAIGPTLIARFIMDLRDVENPYRSATSTLQFFGSDFDLTASRMGVQRR